MRLGTPYLKSILLASLSLATIQLVYAEQSVTVYKTYHPDGSISYSDQPSEQAETIEVKPVDTIPAIDVRSAQSLPARSAPSISDSGSAGVYQQFGITFPENGSAFYSGNGNVKLKIDINPALRDEDSIAIILDGQEIARTNRPEYMLTHLDRGTHSLEVKLLNSQGQPMKSSRSEFTLHRPTVRAP